MLSRERCACAITHRITTFRLTEHDGEMGRVRQHHLWHNGNDILSGGKDTVYGGDGDDIISGGNGVDTLFGDGGNDQLYGDNGSDHLTGGADDDLLDGKNGVDTVNGGAGADVINGGEGDDFLTGGSGADVLTGGVGTDVFDFQFASQGPDEITDFVSGVDFIRISADGFGGGLIAGGAVALISGRTRPHRMVQANSSRYR